MPNIAAIHLIMANSNIDAPVLSASILIFGNKKARHDFVVSDWQIMLADHGDFFAESNSDHIKFLLNSGAEVIDRSMIASRVVAMQTLNQTEGTIWQNHYESHVSHYAYLWAQTGQKRDVMLKGANLDGFSLNAANRFVAECERNVPTGASSPEAGLLYLKELYIRAKRLLGHDIDSDGAKILKERAPSLAPSLPGAKPALPPALPVAAPPTLPVVAAVPAPALPSQKPLTPPALPTTLPPLPKL